MPRGNWSNNLTTASFPDGEPPPGSTHGRDFLLARDAGGLRFDEESSSRSLPGWSSHLSPSPLLRYATGATNSWSVIFISAFPRVAFLFHPSNKQTGTTTPRASPRAPPPATRHLHTSTDGDALTGRLLPGDGTCLVGSVGESKSARQSPSSDRLDVNRRVAGECSPPQRQPSLPPRKALMLGSVLLGEKLGKLHMHEYFPGLGKVRRFEFD